MDSNQPIRDSDGNNLTKPEHTVSQNVPNDSTEGAEEGTCKFPFPDILKFPPPNFLRHSKRTTKEHIRRGIGR